MLPKITEADIVDNIMKRYNYDAVYVCLIFSSLFFCVRHHKLTIFYKTNIGPVLIVVNPYKDLGLCTPEYVRLYRGRFRHELPPHIFALAEETYRNMKGEKADQCCIIR